MMKILAYATEKAVITESDAKTLTHINIASAVLGKDGSIDADHLGIISRFPEIRKWNPHIKIIATVSYREPDAFTACAASERLREEVGKSCVNLISKYGFDGVDFDWEYPCSPSMGLDCSPDDKHNFTLFCRKVRECVDAHEKGHIVSIAAGADIWYAESVELPELAKILDHICLMTYDLKCWFHAQTGHHSQLYSSTGDVFRNSCDQALRLFHEAGVPKEKLLMGAAFYSRKWENLKDRNRGFLQMAKAPAEFGPNYGALLKDYIDKNGYVRYWDDEAKAPFLFNGSTFISYDDEESLVCKCKYIREQGYGGIFYWEHSCDTTGTLLKVIGEQLKA
jgi:chitinase